MMMDLDWTRHTFAAWQERIIPFIGNTVNFVGPGLEVIQNPISVARLAPKLLCSTDRINDLQTYIQQNWNPVVRGFKKNYGIDLNNIMIIPGFTKSYSDGKRFLINRDREKILDRSQHPFNESGNGLEVFVNDLDKKIAHHAELLFNRAFGKAEYWKDTDIFSYSNDPDEVADILSQYSHKQDILLPGGPIPQDIMWHLMEEDNILPYKYSLNEDEENMLNNEKGEPIAPKYKIINQETEEPFRIKGRELSREMDKVDYGMLYVINKSNYTYEKKDEKKKIINISGSGAYATAGIGGRFLSSLGARKGLVHEINKKLENNEKENFVCFFKTEVENKTPIKTDTLDIIPFKIK